MFKNIIGFTHMWSYIIMAMFSCVVQECESLNH